LFEYNELLGSFTLSTEGIIAYIEILNKELEAATNNGQKEIVEGQIK